MAKSVLIAVRLPTNMKTEIDMLVNSGKYRNLSELVRTALRQLLENT